MKKLMLTAAACLALTCAAPAFAASVLVAPALAATDAPLTQDVVVEIGEGLGAYRPASATSMGASLADPEIARWTMLLLGCAGLGAMVRAARHRLLRSLSTRAL